MYGDVPNCKSTRRLEFEALFEMNARKLFDIYLTEEFAGAFILIENTKSVQVTCKCFWIYTKDLKKTGMIGVTTTVLTDHRPR